MSEETKIIASWGEFGLQIKDKFACRIEPNVKADVNGEIETFLLKDPSQIRLLMTYLKEQLNFNCLYIINAIEYKEAIQLIYQLQKLNVQNLDVSDHQMLCVKVNLDKEALCIESIFDIWDSANWYEREIWDMQGIKFANHPNLTRILNPDNWEGFPLRKNYLPPIDALNGVITAVKENIKPLKKSTRKEVEIIVD